MGGKGVEVGNRGKTHTEIDTDTGGKEVEICHKILRPRQVLLKKLA